MSKQSINIQKVKVADLRLDLTNLRGHNEDEIDLLVCSLTIFGQYRPLLVDRNTMQVKVGNGRLMAMRKMGWTECEAILLDWNNRQGLEVIDNRLNELSSWQDKQLNKWFREKGKDWWGLDEEASAKVEKIIEKASRQKEKPQSKAQKPNAPICPCCGKPLVKKQRLVLD